MVHIRMLIVDERIYDSKDVTKGEIIDIARNKLNLNLVEDNFTLYDVYSADECFLTGTAAEVISVVQVDLRTIGNGKPGKITLDLTKEFRKETQSTGTPF